MAQAKAKPSAKRSRGSKRPQARSRGSAGKSTGATGSAAKKTSGAIGDATGKATSAINKAKVPLIAGGAALAGTAGGVVLGARQARRHRHRGRGLAKAAKGAGTLGAQVGHLAYELQRNREAIDGNGSKQHRSPVEVVLEGLTARRSRS